MVVTYPGKDDRPQRGSLYRLPFRADGNDDLSAINGIDEDLVVKAFQWKGNNKTLRQFNRDASHNELGMQADIYMDSKGDIYMNSNRGIQ